MSSDALTAEVLTATWPSCSKEPPADDPSSPAPTETSLTESSDSDRAVEYTGLNGVVETQQKEEMQEHDEPQEEEDEDQQKEQGENDGGDDGHRALHGPGYFKAHARSLLVLLGTVGFGLLYSAMLDGKLDAFIKPVKPWMEHADDASEVFAPQWVPLPAEMDMEENQVCPNGELDDPEIVATLSSCDTIHQ